MTCRSACHATWWSPPDLSRRTVLVQLKIATESLCAPGYVWTISAHVVQIYLDLRCSYVQAMSSVVGNVRNLDVGVSVNLGGSVRTQMSASVNIAVPCKQIRPMVRQSPQPRLSSRLGNWRSYCMRAPFSGESSPLVPLPGTVIGHAHHQCGYGQ